MILQFLADMFQEGRSYRTLNVYRSALSSTLPGFDGISVGQHPLVVRLLKGVLQERPPRPRYVTTWSVSTVTAWIKGLGENQALSLMDLSMKLAVLMALTAARRSSDLHRLNVRSHRFTPDGVELPYLSPPKQRRTVSTIEATPPVLFASYPLDSTLCVVECFREYLTRTNNLRPGTCSQVFISTKRPHKSVSSSTIARWIKNGLARAGIDTAQFGAHSTRSASTSAAKRKGVSTADIMLCADWSSPSVFQRYYFCPLSESESTAPQVQYSRAVLQA